MTFITQGTNVQRIDNTRQFHPVAFASYLNSWICRHTLHDPGVSERLSVTERHSAGPGPTGVIHLFTARLTISKPIAAPLTL